MRVGREIFMPLSEKSAQIGTAFAKYVTTGDKALIDKFTREDIELTLLQYHLDRNMSFYKAMEIRLEELKKVNINKIDKIDNWISSVRNHPIMAILIILGIIVIAVGSFTTSVDNIIKFCKNYLNFGH